MGHRGVQQGRPGGGSLSLAELIDNYGAGLYADLLRYYDVDLTEVIRGNGPAPLLVMALVRGLPDTSTTIGLVHGGYKHVGWGQDRHMLADLIDAIQQNTRATGNFKSPPKIKPYPRPKGVPKPVNKPIDPSKQKVSLAELHAKFTGTKSPTRKE